MSPTFKGYKYTNQPDLKRDAQIAREAAAEGMVLLKNDGRSLPLGKNSKNVALFGINGYEIIAGGTGSGDVNKAYKVSLAQGLAGAGYAVDGDLKNLYTGYITSEMAKRPKKSFFQEFMNPSPPLAEFALAQELVAAKAATADVAIISIGRNAGEGRDRKVENDYELTAAEKALIKNVADVFHAKGKKVVVVLNIGGVIDLMQWRDAADAVLLAWQPGLEGGNAMADVLSGKVTPSGKLATTFAASYNDVPSAKNFPGKEFPEKATTGMMGMKAVPAEVTYEEGVYIGYRYYNTFNVKPAYEFGYGLSYTTFSYSDLKLSAPTFHGKITATVTVTNSGKRPGKEVAQLYISAPAGKMDKPVAELKGFGKTTLLQPGQSQKLTFTVDAADLASFDTNASAWVTDAGKYAVRIGSSSQDIRQTATFSVPKEIVVEKVHKVLVPETTITEMKAATKQAF
jgi:beta-glucosidase